MTKFEWIGLHMNQLKAIQQIDGVGGSLAFAEMSEEFYELFGTELLEEIKEYQNA